MDVTPEPSVICPILIGRSRHLNALEGLMTHVQQGTLRVALISGEAGLGKSRLIVETKTRAAELGFMILQGSCFESDRALPYAPVMDLLHTYYTTHTLDEVGRAFGSTVTQLALLLPELSDALPGLTPTPLLEPEQEKRRLFQALVQFLTRLAADQPLLIIIEDAHWSDETSLEFLLYLARRAGPHPILLALTYRSDEVYAELNHFLAELDRERIAHERVATEIKLAPFTATEVDYMLRTTFDLKRPVRAEFLEAICTLTEGNPFFIEEVLKSLLTAGEIFHADSGWDRKPMNELHIPRSLQDAVQRRVERLSQTTRHTLNLAAVAGQRFDFALLQELVQCTEAELLFRLKELIAAQLVIEESVEQFAFRHALTRQAIYAQLLARERQTLHRAVAETLERVQAQALDQRLADLAYHFYEAGVWEKALNYAQRAGEKAQRMYAPRAAIEQLTRALEATRRLALSPSAQLFRIRGQANETIGDFEAARADYEHELSTARAASDLTAEWQSLIDLGFLWASRDYARTGEYFQQALALVRTLHDPTLLGHTLNRVGNWYVNVEQPVEALRHHREALDIFEELRDRSGQAETLDLLGMTSFLSGDLIEGSAYYQQAIQLFRELGDRPGLCSALATYGERGLNYISDLLAAPPVTVAEVLAEEEEALKIAREIGWRAGEAYALADLSLALASAGQFSRALEALRTSLAIAQEIEHRQWMTLATLSLGVAHYDFIAYPEAREYLEQAASLAHQTGSLNFIRVVMANLALVCVVQNDLTRAEAILDAQLGDVDPHATLDEVVARQQILTMSQRQLWYARAELALAHRDPALALYITEQLMAVASRHDPDHQIVLPRLAVLRAEVIARWPSAAVDSKRIEALADLETARDSAQARGMAQVLWRIRLTLGKLYRLQNRSEEGEAEFSAVRQLVEELAVQLPDQLLRENCLKQMTAMIPTPRPITPRQVEKKKFGGLTERERQVAAFIAQGKSNREIADALFVGERTIETHVSNILSKLGYDARTQIAAWATSRGLLE
jgi:DNA-binding CsgD family transcriptional regulator/tetratricopeptide (TPR) repeat protein